MKSLKYSILPLFMGLLLVGQTALAQRSVIKINIPNLPSQHINVFYEGVLSDQFSIGLGVGITPSRNIPGSGIVQNLILDNPDASNFVFDGTYQKVALTPFIRFYPIKSLGAPRGFHLDAALRYSRHAIKLPYRTNIQGLEIDTEATAALQVIGPAGSIGYQFLFGDRIALDIYAGVGFGFAPFRLEIFDESFTEQTYTDILNRILEELNVSYNVDELPNFITNQGLNFRGSFAMPIVRTGFSIGIAL
ncbi:MAG: hypothetical protein AAFR61_23005 [Bacteroidota bacterium]